MKKDKAEIFHNQIGLLSPKAMFIQNSGKTVDHVVTEFVICQRVIHAIRKTFKTPNTTMSDQKVTCNLRKLLKCTILLSDGTDRHYYFYATDKLGPLVSGSAVC